MAYSPEVNAEALKFLNRSQQYIGNVTYEIGGGKDYFKTPEIEEKWKIRNALIRFNWCFDNYFNEWSEETVMKYIQFYSNIANLYIIPVVEMQGYVTVFDEGEEAANLYVTKQDFLQHAAQNETDISALNTRIDNLDFTGIIPQSFKDSLVYINGELTNPFNQIHDAEHANKTVIDALTQQDLDDIDLANTHRADNTKHVTQADKDAWNAKPTQQQLTDGLATKSNTVHTHTSDQVSYGADTVTVKLDELTTAIANLSPEKGDKGDSPVLTVAATNTIAAGEPASVTINNTDPLNPTLTFNIPEGLGWKPDASGVLADRSTYTAEPAGFSFQDINNGLVYFKLETGVDSWSDAIQTQGDKGWTPQTKLVARPAGGRTEQLVDYIGGSGSKPTQFLNFYRGENGWVSSIELSINVQGPQGPKPVAGTDFPIPYFSIDQEMTFADYDSQKATLLSNNSAGYTVKIEDNAQTEQDGMVYFIDLEADGVTKVWKGPYRFEGKQGPAGPQGASGAEIIGEVADIAARNALTGGDNINGYILSTNDQVVATDIDGVRKAYKFTGVTGQSGSLYWTKVFDVDSIVDFSDLTGTDVVFKRGNNGEMISLMFTTGATSYSLIEDQFKVDHGTYGSFFDVNGGELSYRSDYGAVRKVISVNNLNQSVSLEVRSKSTDALIQSIIVDANGVRRGAALSGSDDREIADRLFVTSRNIQDAYNSSSTGHITLDGTKPFSVYANDTTTPLLSFDNLKNITVGAAANKTNSLKVYADTDGSILDSTSSVFKGVATVQPTLTQLQAYRTDTSLSSILTLDNTKSLLGFTEGAGQTRNITLDATGVKITLPAGDIFSGAAYYGADYTDNSYIQRKYADDNLRGLPLPTIASGTANYLLALNGTKTGWDWVAQSGSGTFLSLSDTPSTFTAGKFVAVNGTATALEFVDSPAGAVIEYGTDSIRTGSDILSYGTFNTTLYGRDLDMGTGNFNTGFGQDIDLNGGAYTTPASMTTYGQSITFNAGGSGANGTVLLGTALTLAAGSKNIMIGFNLSKNYGSQSNVIIAQDSTFATQEKLLSIGWGNTIDATGQPGVETDGGVSIGQGMKVLAARHTQLGHLTQNEGVSNTVIGFGAKAIKPSGLATTVNVTHSLVLSRGAYYKPIVNTTDAGQGAIVFGGIGQNEFADGVSMFFNNGWCHRHYDMNTTNVVSETNAARRRVYIHGTDAYDDIDATSINIAGGDLVMMPGRPTGTGAGGVFRVKVADGTSLGGNVKQATNDKIIIDNGDLTADNTPLQIRVGGVMQRVTVGGADTAGAGFRILRIAN